MEATGLESADEAERGRATAFYAHGTYGPQTIIGAGGRGGFNVTYDPTSGTERITIKGGVKFIDGSECEWWVLSHPGTPDCKGPPTRRQPSPEQTGQLLSRNTNGLLLKKPLSLPVYDLLWQAPGAAAAPD